MSDGAEVISGGTDPYGSAGVAGDEVIRPSLAGFPAQAMIRTPKGEVPVDTLRPGDLVSTLDEGPRPVLWIGRDRPPKGEGDAPVEIAPGVLGAARTTWLAPNHRVLMLSPLAHLLFPATGGEVLVRVRDLVDESSIRHDPETGPQHFVHLLFSRHQIVFVDGVAVESFQPGPEVVQSFDAESRAQLRRAVRAYRLQGQRASRVCLKPKEARLLFEGVSANTLDRGYGAGRYQVIEEPRDERAVQNVRRA